MPSIPSDDYFTFISTKPCLGITGNNGHSCLLNDSFLLWNQHMGKVMLCSQQYLMKEGIIEKSKSFTLHACSVFMYSRV